MNPKHSQYPEHLRCLIQEREKLWKTHDQLLPELNQILRHCKSQSMPTLCPSLTISPSSQGLTRYQEIKHHLENMADAIKQIDGLQLQIQSTERHSKSEIERLNSLLAVIRKRWITVWKILLILAAITFTFIL